MSVVEKLFFVSLRGLTEGRNHFELSEAGSSLGFPGDEVSIDSDIGLDLTLDRTATLIAAKGVVQAQPTMTCARCLEPFEPEMTIEFEVVIRLGGDNFRLEDEEDTSVDFIADGVSFAPSVRESLILAFPLKPLCSEECSGLCPRCGANRNISPCDCPDSGADPRWEGLNVFMEDKRGEQADGRS